MQCVIKYMCDKLESGSQTTPRLHLVTMATLGVVWE